MRGDRERLGPGLPVRARGLTQPFARGDDCCLTRALLLSETLRVPPQRLRRHREKGCFEMPNNLKICAIEGCDAVARKTGRQRPDLCSAHHALWRDAECPGPRRAEYGEARAWIYAVACAFNDPNVCLIWPFFRNATGYAYCRSEDRKSFLVSRYVCILKHGEPPDKGMEAAHTCGKGSSGCVNPLHIRWATQEENNADKVLHGTHTGRRVYLGLSRINEVSVREIRNLHASGFSAADIAERLNLHLIAVDNVIARKWWGWVE